MAGFNKNIDNAVTTYEGGKAYKRDELKAWLNFLMGSYLEPQFYESRNVQMERFVELTNKIGEKYGAEFAAKAAMFARDDLGMRSVSQFVAAILNSQKFENKRAFFRNFCVRPDDVAEIFAAIDALGEKRSHALVRGCGDYLSGLSGYQVGKYKLNGKDYNMYDLINITHAHSAAIDAYKEGTLEAPDTWEVAISDSNKSQEERDKEWLRLVEEEKLGYMALLRNLRNILEAIDRTGSETALVSLQQQLVNTSKIRASRVFPYRIYTAWRTIAGYHPNEYWSYTAIPAVPGVDRIESELEFAFKMAAFNAPTLSGKNVAIIDVSGSMENPLSNRSVVSCKQAAACQAMTMILQNPETIVIKFGDHAKVCRSYSQAKGHCFSYIDYLTENEDLGFGTDLVDIPDILNAIGEFDRVFLYSDFQVMESSSYWYIRSEGSIKEFSKTIHEKGAYVYSFDLANYSGSVVSDSPKVMYLSGFNDKLYSLIPLLESDGKLEEYIAAKRFE